MTRVRGPGLAALVVVVTTTALFWPLVLGALTGAPRFFEWDVPEQYWGDLVYLCRSLHHGQLPYWNPYDRGGYPYYADPQAGTFHPLAWGICALAGPAPGLGWQEARVVLGFACAGAFGALWLRRLGASWQACALGAAIAEAAPFMRHNWELNLTSALGWLPMVLWALEGLLARRRWRDVAWLALAEGLLVWTGSPPAAWLAGSFTALYGLARLIEVGRAEGRGALTTLAPRLALACVLAIGLSAVVVVPALGLASHSVQAGRAYASIADEGLDWRGATALFWPRDGNHLYVGWIALALAPLAFLREERLPGRVALVVLALVALALALGDHTPLFRIAFELVPGVRLFRLPHRYEAWLGPCAAALAAGGLDALRERLPAWLAGREAKARALAAGLALAALAWLVLGSGLAPFALAAGAALVVVTALAPTELAWSATSLVLGLLLLADVSQRMPADRHTRAFPAPADPETAAAVIARAPSMGRAYRVFDEFAISCRAGTRLGLRDLRGYQDPLLLHAYERVVDALGTHPQLAMQYGVRYALTSPHFLHGWDHHYLPRPEVLAALPGARDLGGGVIELGGALPWAYVVPDESIVRVARREDALAWVRDRAPSPLAVLEGARALAGAGGRPPLWPARVVAFEPDAMRIAVDAPAPGVLVVNEVWYPGWRARVDGADVPVVRANALVRGVRVPAGPSTVTLRFEPDDGAPLRWLWLASWLALLALASSAWWTPRRAVGKDARR